MQHMAQEYKNEHIKISSIMEKIHLIVSKTAINSKYFEMFKHENQEVKHFSLSALLTLLVLHHLPRVHEEYCLCSLLEGFLL